MNFLSLPFRAIRKIYRHFFAAHLVGKVKVDQRHDSYDDYVKKQKEKTEDPARIKEWLGDGWEEKLEGFRHLFARNDEFVAGKKNAICLGARTGQEVCALQERGLKAIGIDLVPFEPYTIEGDIHDLQFKDGSFDLVFTNIFDHTPYPQRFVEEMERVCTKGGHIIVNLQVKTDGDEYSENVVYDASGVVEMFKASELSISRTIKNTFDGMNREVVMQKK